MKSPKKASPKRRAMREPKITKQELRCIIERLKKIESSLPSKSGRYPVTDYEKELCRRAFELILGRPWYAFAASIGRELGVSYCRATKIMHALEEHGYVGETLGPNRPRRLLKKIWRGI